MRISRSPIVALAGSVALLVGACSGASTSPTPGSSAAAGAPSASAANASGSAGASGSAAASGSQPAGSATGLKAVYVSTEPIGQNPFLELIGEGLTKGGQECGVQTKIVESADVSSMEDNLRAVVDEGYDLVVANSFDSVDAVTRLSADHPNQKWALVDTSIEGNNNVRGLVFKEHEGAYLLGATVGLLATGKYQGYPKSDRIGAVGAVDQPFIRRWFVGFQEGVKAVDPSATLDLGWATGFNDPATSKELALAQNDRGAKYVFAFSAAGNTGVFEAAKERNFMTTGVDTDQRSVDPDHIVESMVKRTDVGVHDTVCDLAKGQFSGGAKAYGLAERGVGPSFITLDNPQPPSRLPQAVTDKVKELAGQIVSGQIKVTDYLAKQ